MSIQGLHSRFLVTRMSLVFISLALLIFFLAAYIFGPETSRSHITTFSDAENVALATANEGDIYVAIGQQNALFVTRSTSGGRSFSTPVRATGDKSAYIHPLESPALAVSVQGTVSIGWLETTGSGTNIWYSDSADGGQTFAPATLVGTSKLYETVMVQVASDREQNPFLLWLGGGGMRSARSVDGGKSFVPVQTIDDTTCECCLPGLLVRNQQVLIAYRNRDQDAERRVMRDIYIARSEDGGVTFAEPMAVSDAHWYLDACPVSGPAIAADEGHIYVAWMDERNDTNNSLLEGDIWFAASTDRGQSFGANKQLSLEESIYSNLPSLAVGPNGRLHADWEVLNKGRKVIYYTISDDFGQTLAPLQVVVSSDDGTERGEPHNAALAVNDLGHVHLAAWCAPYAMALSLTMA